MLARSTAPVPLRPAAQSNAQQRHQPRVGQQRGRPRPKPLLRRSPAKYDRLDDCRQSQQRPQPTQSDRPGPLRLPAASHCGTRQRAAGVGGEHPADSIGVAADSRPEPAGQQQADTRHRCRGSGDRQCIGRTPPQRNQARAAGPERNQRHKRHAAARRPEHRPQGRGRRAPPAHVAAQQVDAEQVTQRGAGHHDDLRRRHRDNQRQ